MVVGVVALQGAEKIGSEGCSEQLQNVSSLIIPGGESTTMAKLITCLVRIYMVSERNKGKLGQLHHYIQSFETELPIPEIAAKEDVSVSSVESANSCSAVLNEEESTKSVKRVIVAVKQGNILATAFHPALTADTRCPGDFPLNVTTSGNQVNVSTGIVDATVANTIYTDNELAVYQVDKVLQPLSIFASPAPATAPEPEPETLNLKKKSPEALSPSSGSDDAPADKSGADSLRGVAVLGVGVLFFCDCGAGFDGCDRLWFE
ncbi:hypothetical protein RND71_010022 [Anisodus tanguticus]|uniref:Glutaminase n=1 Tax=Anisodus tanguticus TaxID=243964 RepID=A0AAE1SJJ5_9SOLA|nr:hypothetical protein RND71_010022 [Anisodus tanguticus]